MNQITSQSINRLIAFICAHSSRLKPATRGQDRSDSIFTLRSSGSVDQTVQGREKISVGDVKRVGVQRAKDGGVILQPFLPDPRSFSHSQAMQLQPTSVGCVQLGIDWNFNFNRSERSTVKRRR
ncbi:hypothetical protein SLA2020_129440 [Shorea laevis]